MALSIPSPSVNSPRAFIGHLQIFGKGVANAPHGGARIFVQIPTVELRENFKCPTRGTR